MVMPKIKKISDLSDERFWYYFDKMMEEAQRRYKDLYECYRAVLRENKQHEYREREELAREAEESLINAYANQVCDDCGTKGGLHQSWCTFYP
jgi:hypothetical protein